MTTKSREEVTILKITAATVPTWAVYQSIEAVVPHSFDRVVCWALVQRETEKYIQTCVEGIVAGDWMELAEQMTNFLAYTTLEPEEWLKELEKPAAGDFAV